MSADVAAAQNPRLLLVGFSERYKYFGQMFYATFQMMRNGFIRAGAGAYLFSDRDAADFAAPFAIRQIGKMAANRQLIELAELMAPAAVCLMHADLIEEATIAEVRRRVPGVKIFSYFIDPIGDERQRERFIRYVRMSDVSFVTTAGPTLAGVAAHGDVGFMPNPVDRSVFYAQSFAGESHAHDFFFAGKPKGREDLLERLQARLPERDHGYYLRVARGSKLAIGGITYLQTLAKSKIAINAAIDESPYLYSSDRVAQYFSAGCLVAQPKGPVLEDLYGGDSMLTFADDGDLADQAERVLADGSWREIARHGQEQAFAVSDSALIARYMLDRCFERQTFEWPAWSSEFYRKGDAPSAAGGIGGA